MSFLLISFFFNDTATTEIYTLSLHDALPILNKWLEHTGQLREAKAEDTIANDLTSQLISHQQLPTVDEIVQGRSEEHTSELQSQFHLVCRLLLEKKKKKKKTYLTYINYTSNY